MRRALFLILALLAFGLAAWLMRRDEPIVFDKGRDRPSFPTRASPQDRARAKARRTLLPSRPVDVPPGEEAPEVVAADPLDLALRSLPTGDGTMVVLEANAIRHSPLGELLLECLSAEVRGEIAKVKDETGVDMIEGLDRISVGGEKGVVITGELGGLREQFATSKDLLPYGDKGLIGASREQFNVVWGDELFASVPTREDAERMIDVLEGRAPPPTESRLESMAYGEAYGTVPPDKLARFFPEEQAAVRDEFLRVIEQVELHADTAGDPGLAFHVGGEDRQGVDELARALGGALSLARTSAGITGDDDLAKLLEYARVAERRDGAFTLEMVLPLEVIRDELLECKPGGGRVDAGVEP